MWGWVLKIIQGVVVILSYYTGRVEGEKDSKLKEAEFRADQEKLISDDLKRIEDEDQAINDRYSSYRRKLRGKNSPDKDKK